MNKKEYHRIYYKKNKIKILKRSYSKNKQCKCGVLICNTSKQCQNCGMTEEEHLIVKGRVLDIHHIDYNKQNCQKSNLITACQVCNIRANFNRDYWYAYFTYIMEH